MLPFVSILVALILSMLINDAVGNACLHEIQTCSDANSRFTRFAVYNLTNQATEAAALCIQTDSSYTSTDAIAILPSENTIGQIFCSRLPISKDVVCSSANSSFLPGQLVLFVSLMWLSQDANQSISFNLTENTTETNAEPVEFTLYYGQERSLFSLNESNLTVSPGSNISLQWLYYGTEDQLTYNKDTMNGFTETTDWCIQPDNDTGRIVPNASLLVTVDVSPVLLESAGPHTISSDQYNSTVMLSVDESESPSLNIPANTSSILKVEINTSAKIPCSISHTNTFRPSWYFNNIPITNSPENYFLEVKQLHLLDITIEHLGWYTCVASNTNGTVYRDFLVVPIDTIEPNISHNNLFDTSVQNGRNVSFLVVAETPNNLSLSWSYNSPAVSNITENQLMASNYTVGVSSLIVNDCDPSDSGDYAVNSINISAMLQVVSSDCVNNYLRSPNAEGNKVEEVWTLSTDDARIESPENETMETHFILMSNSANSQPQISQSVTLSNFPGLISLNLHCRMRSTDSSLRPQVKISTDNKDVYITLPYPSLSSWQWVTLMNEEFDVSSDDNIIITMEIVNNDSSIEGFVQFDDFCLTVSEVSSRPFQFLLIIVIIAGSFVITILCIFFLAVCIYNCKQYRKRKRSKKGNNMTENVELGERGTSNLNAVNIKVEESEYVEDEPGETRYRSSSYDYPRHQGNAEIGKSDYDYAIARGGNAKKNGVALSHSVTVGANDKHLPISPRKRSGTDSLAINSGTVARLSGLFEMLTEEKMAERNRVSGTTSPQPASPTLAKLRSLSDDNEKKEHSSSSPLAKQSDKLPKVQQTASVTSSVSLKTPVKQSTGTGEEDDMYDVCLTDDVFSRSPKLDKRYQSSPVIGKPKSNSSAANLPLPSLPTDEVYENPEPPRDSNGYLFVVNSPKDQKKKMKDAVNSSKDQKKKGKDTPKTPPLVDDKDDGYANSMELVDSNGYTTLTADKEIEPGYTSLTADKEIEPGYTSIKGDKEMEPYYKTVFDNDQETYANPLEDEEKRKPTRRMTSDTTGISEIYSSIKDPHYDYCDVTGLSAAAAGGRVNKLRQNVSVGSLPNPPSHLNDEDNIYY